MANFFDRMLGRNSNKNSSRTAKERLKFVLLHDRMNLPPEKMEMMKEEIMAVISKYVQVQRDEVDIALEQRDRHSQKIVAQIPFSKEDGNKDGDDDENNDNHSPHTANG